MYLFILLILGYHIKVVDNFSPDTTNYDAYGIKIAANDVIFVEAKSSGQTFLVQFAPYNFTLDSLQCSISYDDSTHYVYTVGVGQKQNTSLNPYFYFAGEVVTQGWISTDMSGHNGSFIGIWINRDSQTAQQYTSSHQPLPCNQFQVTKLQFLSSYGHQEFFVIAVEPYGQYAIGLATKFVFIYRPFSNNTMTSKGTSTVWPNNSTFNPCAADASQKFTIVAGFVAGSARSRVRATPTVYLLLNDNLTVVSSWTYTAANDSWQSRLAYSNADMWSSEYTMSVKINADDPTRVLVGMPFINTVFLFVVDNNGTNLTLASYLQNGNSVGFGKSVSWLTASQAAILVAKYSSNYVAWISTQIYVYTSLNDSTMPSFPSAVIPNNQQPLPSTINSKLIRMISTPSSLAVLDTNGGALLILAGDPGYYASTDTSNSLVAASMPVVSRSMTCIGGTYKMQSGIHNCILCPIGSRNPGIMAGTSCTACSANSFCPLGAVYDIDPASLTSLSQAYAYPRSPDMDVFEDILLNNMFSLGTTTHCLMVSPIFWILILGAIIVIALASVFLLKRCVGPRKHHRLTKTMKEIFERTDLVGEGELWVGGLVSLAIILISVMAYVFGISYLNQYPGEISNPSNFACDTTIRNAKYQSTLQALAVPVSDEEKPMFTLLNEQNFTLHIDFINTGAICPSLSVSKVTDSTTVALPLKSCSNINGTLSASIILTVHETKIVATISNVQLIGGLGIGLSGPSAQDESHTLKELNFRQTFYSPSSGTLAQTANIYVELTKAINETLPLSGDGSKFEGLWYPTFQYSLDAMFMSADSYIMYANLTSTTVTISIAETAYYIKNEQAPITKEAEVLFRTLLFSFLCLEICTMVFVISKLFLIPVYATIEARLCGQSANVVEPEEEMKIHH